MGGGRAPHSGARLLMKNTIRHRSRALILGFLFLTAAVLFLVRLPFLVVSGEAGAPSLYLPLYRDRDFSISYTHSVHKTPVWENFTAGAGDRLVLTSTSFESLGVGIPFLPGDGKLTSGGGRFILTGQGRSFPEVSLRVSPVAGQALVRPGGRYDLGSYFGSNALVSVRIARCSPGMVFWQVFAHGGELLD